MSDHEMTATLQKLLASDDASDRALAAQELGGMRTTPEVLETLRGQLEDIDHEVVAFAAQSLALHGDVSSLDRIMAILREQTGDDVTPVAWATARLAASSDPATRERAMEALESLSQRGSTRVKQQVEILLVRL